MFFLYFGTATAWHIDEDGLTIYRSYAVLVRAKHIEKAFGKVNRDLIEQCPPDAGWQGHEVSLVPVDPFMLMEIVEQLPMPPRKPILIPDSIKPQKFALDF